MADPEEEFGRKVCTLPGYELVWVRFKTRGYPFKLRQEWRDTDDRGALDIILRYIVDANLPNGNGQPLEFTEPRTAALFDNVEESLVVWLINAFVQFWRVELPHTSKNL